MQLVAYGAQDVYLTGNPQITFFKVVYRRHTNFSMESIAQTWNGTVGKGNSVTCTIARNGDLVSSMYLEMNLSRLEILQNDKRSPLFLLYVSNIIYLIPHASNKSNFLYTKLKWSEMSTNTTHTNFVLNFLSPKNFILSNKFFIFIDNKPNFI